MGAARKTNEDAFLQQPELALWAVADGMGGHEAGSHASRTVAECLRDLPPDDAEGGREAAARARLRQANEALRDYAKNHTGGRVVGTTAAVLLGDADGVSCLWAGDSRIYRLRDGVLSQLTRDHSRVEDLIERGLIDRTEVQFHPAANVITRAVGAAARLDVDLARYDLSPEDVYLLCSDGLTKAVSEPEIARLLQEPECQAAVDALLAQAKQEGASDDVTLIVVRPRAV